MIYHLQVALVARFFEKWHAGTSCQLFNWHGMPFGMPFLLFNLKDGFRQWFHRLSPFLETFLAIGGFLFWYICYRKHTESLYVMQ